MSLYMVIGTCGAYRAKMRTHLSRFPRNGDCLNAGIASHLEYDGGRRPVPGKPLPLISKGGTSTLINCAYIGMILSVSRYTAYLEEQKERNAQLQMQTEATGTTEAQTAAEPTAQVLNSDAEFEEEKK